MTEKKFDPKKLKKLNNPGRLIDVPPAFIWEQLNIPNAKLLLDIGAGTGLFSSAFAKIAPQCAIMALDISEVMLDWMNENICPTHPTITTMLMKEHQVSLDDCTADIVIMINLHHEIENPKLLVNECYRLLKSGGKIAISDWRKEDIEKGPSVEIRVDAKVAAAELEEVGFKNVRIFDDFKYNWLIVAEKA